MKKQLPPKPAPVPRLVSPGSGSSGGAGSSESLVRRWGLGGGAPHPSETSDSSLGPEDGPLRDPKLGHWREPNPNVPSTPESSLSSFSADSFGD